LSAPVDCSEVVRRRRRRRRVVAFSSSEEVRSALRDRDDVRDDEERGISESSVDLTTLELRRSACVPASAYTVCFIYLYNVCKACT